MVTGGNNLIKTMFNIGGSLIEDANRGNNLIKTMFNIGGSPIEDVNRGNNLIKTMFNIGCSLIENVNRGNNTIKTMLTNSDFTDLIDESADVDSRYTIFYNKIEDILVHVAPYRKMTRKEIKLEQMPWVTRGILVSTMVRNTLYKTWSSEKELQYKIQIFTIYKRYRNMIVSLLKRSKSNYYSLFFLQNQSNGKKKHGKAYEI